VQCSLEEIAILLQRFGRIIEQSQRAPRIGVITLEQQRQDEPCGGGADSARQQLLGKADERHRGEFVAIERPAFFRFKLLEGTLRSLYAEVASDRILELVYGNGGAEATQAWHRPSITRHEQ